MNTPVDRPVSGVAGAPPLFLPDEEFPPYRFVPGATPHPFKQPGGYALGHVATPPEYLPAEAWRENPAFLRGCDFFNRGWWWEAHEVWEGLWHVCRERDEDQAALLQSLIQLAAAALNRERGHDPASGRLVDRATERLADLGQAHARLCGLDLAALIAEAKEQLGHTRDRVDGYYLIPS
jgi:predicted metal-dependent hydrolase